MIEFKKGCRGQGSHPYQEDGQSCPGCEGFMIISTLAQDGAILPK